MAEHRIQRRLAAVLATDMVGYSRLMATDETGTLARLKALRADLFNPKIAEYQGRIVKEMGDGMLVEFASAVDAVECAVAVQRAIAEREAHVAEDIRIRYRVGINLGDIIIDGDDILGDGVNVAARLEGLAEPAGISISGTIYDQIHNKLDLTYDDLGIKSLKNIKEPIRVFRVHLFGRPGAPDLSAAESQYRVCIKARFAEDAAFYVPLAGKTTEVASAQPGKAPRSAGRRGSRARFEYHEWIPVGEDIKQVKIESLREAVEKYSCIVLLGEPGCGKTTAIESLTYDYAHQPDRLPLLLHLDEFTGGASVEDFIIRCWGGSPRAGHWGAPELAAQLATYLEAGKLFFLFDALNEMPIEGFCERCAALRVFIDRGSAQGNRFLVTCRILDYGGEFSGLQRVEIQPLSDDQIRRFLQNELPTRWQVLWDMLRSDDSRHRLLEMARNPYLLTIMIDVFEEDGELSINRADLMRRFTQIMLEWARVKCPPEQWLDAELQTEALAVMAYEMQVRSGFGTKVKTEQVKAVMPRRLQPDPNWPAKDVPPDQVLNLAANANIVEMPVDRLTVRFYHQLLQEYFAARQLLKQDPTALADLWRGPGWNPRCRLGPVLKTTMSHYRRHRRPGGKKPPS
jgi:class 3 adenylate cyclase